MERVRYVGDLPAVDLTIPGAALRFERMKWQDPSVLCDEANVPVEHLTIVIAGLGDDWEREGPVKAARTRKTKQQDTSAPADDTPAEPDEEKS